MIGMSNQPNPFNQLAGIITREAQRRASEAVIGQFMELGRITSTGLKLDSFTHEIQDYFIADYLTMDRDFFTMVEEHSGGHQQTEYDGKHDHNVVTPKQLKPLSFGDRVLVAPISGGNYFVVVARVVGNNA